MSGQLSTALAAAAGRHARAAAGEPFQLTPRDDPRRVELMRQRAAIIGRVPPESDSLPGRTWRAMHPVVRTALVMLYSDAKGDARTLAVRAWESIPDDERGALAAGARMFASELRNASCLL